MKDVPTYLLCHGFGFTDEYWKNFLPLLDGDFEFFHDGFSPNPEKIYVGIGHSLGFLRLNNSKIKFRALIGLQGFLNFCGSDPTKKKFLQKNLDRMIFSFEKDPKRALEFFHELCGYDGKIPSDFFVKNSREKLIGELEMMKSSFKHCKIPTLIIGSEDDPVVEKGILVDNFRNEDFIDLRFLDGGNHTLGYTKATEIFALIQDFLAGIVQ